MFDLFHTHFLNLYDSKDYLLSSIIENYISKLLLLVFVLIIAGII